MTDRHVIKGGSGEPAGGIGHQAKPLLSCGFIGEVFVRKSVHQKTQVHLFGVSSYYPRTVRVTPPGQSGLNLGPAPGHRQRSHFTDTEVSALQAFETICLQSRAWWLQRLQLHLRVWVHWGQGAEVGRSKGSGAPSRREGWWSTFPGFL